MTLSISQQQLVEQFSQLKSWEDKYRFILRLGKSVPAMNDVLKVDDVLLNGCESNVWFYGEVVDNRLQLNIYSDAKIVRGLIAIICESFQGLALDEVVTFDCAQFLEELGLLSHLSPSRGNGIRAIIEQIAKVAQKR